MTDSRIEVAETLIREGAAAKETGRYSKARAKYKKALALAVEVGGEEGERVAAKVYRRIGVVHFGKKQYGAARNRFLESLSVFRRLGDREETAWSLIGLGAVSFQKEDLVSAEAYFEDALGEARMALLHEVEADLHHNLGKLASGRNDYKKARDHFKLALPIFHKLPDKRAICYSLEALAGVALVERKMERAASLHGAAAKLRKAIGSFWTGAEHTQHDPEIKSLHAALGEEKFIAAWEYGQGLVVDGNPEQAVAFALSP